jgi:hypothetical protein
MLGGRVCVVFATVSKKEKKDVALSQCSTHTRAIAYVDVCACCMHMSYAGRRVCIFHIVSITYAGVYVICLHTCLYIYTYNIETISVITTIYKICVHTCMCLHIILDTSILFCDRDICTCAEREREWMPVHIYVCMTIFTYACMKIDYGTDGTEAGVNMVNWYTKFV